MDAINTSCADVGAASTRGVPASGDAKCRALSTPDAPLVCGNGTCQLACMRDIDCPPAHACNAGDGGSGFCVNPTCPS
jgi:hypothetical protein